MNKCFNITNAYFSSPIDAFVRIHCRIWNNYSTSSFLGLIFFLRVFLSGFYWNRIDSKSLQVTMTLRSTLADFNSAVSGWFQFFLWSPVTLISFPRSLKTTPMVPISIIVNFIFHSFLNSRARSKCLFIFSLFLKFLFPGTAKSTNWQVLFLINSRSGLVA